MAKKKVSPELEEAILGLPLKEKHKLLLRLINKEELLVEQLQYRLLENSEADLVYRRNDLKEKIDKIFKTHTLHYYKDLLFYIRDGVSLINRHMKITKDKRGELELLIFLHQAAFTHLHRIKNNWRDQLYLEKLVAYSGSKIEKMNALLQELHEDFRIEFEEDIAGLRTQITVLNRSLHL